MILFTSDVCSLFWHPSRVLGRFTPRSGGVAGAQPPANFWQPFGLLSAMPHHHKFLQREP